MIDVSDVRKRFRSGDQWVEALRGVSCRIPRGRCAFIIGPSGSGKSTLLYLIGALDRPTSGSIRVDGQDLTSMTEVEQNAYRRERIGFIYQSFNLIGNLTALENVLVSYIPRGVSSDLKQTAADLLCQVGLGSRLDHRPYQLSGGEQQRVAIARAIAKRPDVLLCDEPTGALDAATGAIVLGALSRVNRELGTTTAVITHNAVIGELADRVLRLADGQLVSDQRNEQRVAPEALRW
jgi:ABC-type lipoprotein export system ATPase subunit